MSRTKTPTNSNHAMWGPSVNADHRRGNYHTMHRDGRGARADTKASPLFTPLRPNNPTATAAAARPAPPSGVLTRFTGLPNPTILTGLQNPTPQPAGTQTQTPIRIEHRTLEQIYAEIVSIKKYMAALLRDKNSINSLSNQLETVEKKHAEIQADLKALHQVVIENKDKEIQDCQVALFKQKQCVANEEFQKLQQDIIVQRGPKKKGDKHRR